MNNATTNPILCKKLSYRNSHEADIKPTIILGIVVSEDEHFLDFRTAKRMYRINKQLVISLEDTDVVFRGDYRK